MHPPDPYRGDIGILEFLRAVLEDWRIAGAIVLVAALVSIGVALLLTPLYRVETVVVEVGDAQSTSGVSAMLGELGSLGSLAGIDISKLGQAKGTAKPILNSRRLVEEFIRRHDLLPVLFADEWDAEAGRWLSDPEDTPTLWLGVKRFTENVLEIRDDPAAGVIRVSVEWTDPEIAAAWANDIVALANETVRSRDLQEAERNLAYLNEQLSKTNVVGLQSVLYGLVEQQMKTIMLANARSEYAFAVIDPAVPPELRTFPHRTLIVAIGTIAGSFIALVIVLVRLIIRKQRALERRNGAGVSGARPGALAAEPASREADG
jgi:uncharacterized protein involved in exopolysaccharide biosynthesis